MVSDISQTQSSTRHEGGLDKGQMLSLPRVIGFSDQSLLIVSSKQGPGTVISRREGSQEQGQLTQRSQRKVSG